MHWIYLSPHIDDVALSCGGLIWEQAKAGDQVEVWTLCAGDPPPGPFSEFVQELHARWQTGPQAVAARRLEDIASCEKMNATPRHFPLPDCIYRRAGLDYWRPASSLALEDEHFLYPDRDAIFGPLHPLEAEMVGQVSQRLSQDLPGQAELVVPLTIGGHVDHRLARAVAEMLPRPLWYYADFPYIGGQPEQLDRLLPGASRPVVFPVSPQGLEAWCAAVAAHRSQISTFWPDLAAMRADLHAYCERSRGTIIWQLASRELA